MKLCKESFLNLMDRFSKQVKAGICKKLDYNLWRDLYAWAKNGAEAEISREYGRQVSLRIINPKRTYYFENDDNSFGAYLSNELDNADLVKAINSKVCVFGEPNANKSVIDYGSVDLDNVAINYDLDTLKFGTMASGTGIAYGNVEFDTIPTMSDLAITRDRVEQLGKMVVDHMDKENIIKERKDNEKMKGFNFDFGSCEHDNVRMSMYGLAVKNATGTWVSYDPAAKTIVDVDILNFEGGKYMYKMPVAIKDIKPGDVIVHARKPLFVTEVVKEKLIAIDPFAGEEKIVLPTRSCFGFDFATKIVCLFDGMTGGASAAAPFGNMLPFLMMSDNGDMDPAMLLLAMGGEKLDMSNPMMLYFLMKDGGNSDLLPLMLMGNFGKTCDCNCHCGKEE